MTSFLTSPLPLSGGGNEMPPAPVFLAQHEPSRNGSYCCQYPSLGLLTFLSFPLNPRREAFWESNGRFPRIPLASHVIMEGARPLCASAQAGACAREACVSARADGHVQPPVWRPAAQELLFARPRGRVRRPLAQLRSVRSSP